VFDKDGKKLASVGGLGYDYPTHQVARQEIRQHPQEIIRIRHERDRHVEVRGFSQTNFFGEYHRIYIMLYNLI
jgi:hypothetical protein